MRKCPFCAALVKAERFCRSCGREMALAPPPAPPLIARPETKEKFGVVWIVLVSLVALGVIISRFVDVSGPPDPEILVTYRVAGNATATEITYKSSRGMLVAHARIAPKEKELSWEESAVVLAGDSAYVSARNETTEGTVSTAILRGDQVLKTAGGALNSG